MWFKLEKETQIIATKLGWSAVFEFNHSIKHDKIHGRELESYRKPYDLEQRFSNCLGWDFQVRQVLLVSCEQENAAGSAQSSWVITYKN